VCLVCALEGLLLSGLADPVPAPPEHDWIRAGMAFGASASDGPFRWTTYLAVLVLAGVVVALLKSRAKHAQAVAELRGTARLAAATLQRERTENTLLDGVVQRINAGLKLDEILNFTFESFEALMPYERMGFALIEDGGATVRTHWSRSKCGGIRLGVGYAARLARSSLEEVVRTGVPRILNDLAEYLQRNPESTSTKLIVEEGMQSSLTCPLVANGKPVGFLFFSSRTPFAYQQVHVNRFMRLARTLSFIVEKARYYEETARAHARLASLMDNLLPPAVHHRLRPGEEVLVADSFEQVTVVFADLVRFSDWSAQMPPERVVQLLNRIFSRFDRLVSRIGLQKIGTQGDSYLVVAGAPLSRPDHAAAAASFALAMQRTLARFRQIEHLPIEARIGVHTGPVIAGIIGRTVHRYDVWGRTVNLASRLESTAEPGLIQVSDPTFDLLRNDFEFEERGWIELKGSGLQRTHWLLRRKNRNGPGLGKVCGLTSSRICACRQPAPSPPSSSVPPSASSVAGQFSCP